MLESALVVAMNEVEAVRGRLRALQVRCDHCDAVRTTHQGETCHHCPDCGACGV